MVRKQLGVFEGYPSRRDVLKGLAGCIILLGMDGCAQALSSSSAPVSTATPRPHGSVYYTYHGHTDRITSVAWSANGKYIASGSLDKTVQVWASNPAEHLQPHIFRGHTSGVLAVTWSPDSSRIASGGMDKTVQVWDALNGEHAVTYQGHTDVVNTVAWSPNGNYIATGSDDTTLRMWDVASGKQMYVYHGHRAGINSIVWSPDSQQIASGSTDTTVQVLDAVTGNHSNTYHGHSGRVSSVTWSPDGKYIASGSWDKTVQVWNPTTGAVLYTYNGYNTRAAQLNPTKGVLPDLIFVVAWSHNGERIAAVTQDYCGDICGVIVSWDAYTERNFTFFQDSPTFALAWSPDDTRLVTSIENFVQGPLPHNAPQEGPYVQISQA